MFSSPDPIGLVLRPALVAPPGTAFHYSSGSTNALGEVIHKRTGSTLAGFADFTQAPAVVVASSNLYLRPRDMAKLGELYLRGGVWQGARIVSEEWVRESTTGSIPVPPGANPLELVGVITAGSGSPCAVPSPGLWRQVAE